MSRGRQSRSTSRHSSGASFAARHAFEPSPLEVNRILTGLERGKKGKRRTKREPSLARVKFLEDPQP